MPVQNNLFSDLEATIGQTIFMVLFTQNCYPSGQISNPCSRVPSPTLQLHLSFIYKLQLLTDCHFHTTILYCLVQYCYITKLLRHFLVYLFTLGVFKMTWAVVCTCSTRTTTALLEFSLPLSFATHHLSWLPVPLRKTTHISSHLRPSPCPMTPALSTTTPEELFLTAICPSF